MKCCQVKGMILQMYSKKSYYFLKLLKCRVDSAILQRKMQKLLSKIYFSLNLRLGHVFKMSLMLACQTLWLPSWPTCWLGWPPDPLSGLPVSHLFIGLLDPLAGLTDSVASRLRSPLCGTIGHRILRGCCHNTTIDNFKKSYRALGTADQKTLEWLLKMLLLPLKVKCTYC